MLAFAAAKGVRSAGPGSRPRDVAEHEPLNELRPEVLPDLAAVAQKMMAKEAAERHQTPGERAKALLPFVKTGHCQAFRGFFNPVRSLLPTSRTTRAATASPCAAK